MHDTLVATEILAAHLADPDWAVFDCRSVLGDPEAGPKAYAQGHVPGARYIHLERELSGPVTPDTGRHPLPDPSILAGILGRAGVDGRVQIVAYDDAGGVYAARLWWLTRWLGHTRVAVLNGGWQQWMREGRPVSTDAVRPAARQFDFKGTVDAAWLSTAEVLEMVRGRKRGLLLDARAPVRYRGEQEPIDPVAGHVPGAVNLPHAGNVSEDGRFNDPAALRQRYEAALCCMRPEQAVCMCGSGVTACHNLLAMEIAGLKGARLYAGSWSEWIRDPARPVARPA
jgi:thiosulfate/3-mercaptopyruvate sulfurtransferase